MTSEPQDLTRRDFLQYSAALGSAALLATMEDLEAGTAPGPQTPAWFDQPMRWAQLVLVENDPGRFDLTFWLDYFRRIHADAACLSAGGVVAFYPTQVPLHHRSAWL